MHLKKILLKIAFFLTLLVYFTDINAQSERNLEIAIQSIETGFTILKVNTASSKKEKILITSSYEGTLLGISFSGKILWKNELSGYMNHDIYIRDLNNDGFDEILVANANGTLYCVSTSGKILWEFKKNEAPLYAVTAIKKDNKTYLAVGGFDTNFYYLDNNGKLLKTIKSSSYSIEKPWRNHGKKIPPKNISTANFIRTIKDKNGKEILVVLGTNNQMQVPGTLYFFNPLEEYPFRKTPIKKNKTDKKIGIKPIGDFSLVDFDNDGKKEILLGSSSHVKDMLVTMYNVEKDSFVFHKIKNIQFGYDTAQSEVIKQNEKEQIVTRAGNQFLFYNLNQPSIEERITTKFAYFDFYKVPNSSLLILASAQSGGSSIHLINTNYESWKKELENLHPKGKIASIISTTKSIKAKLDAFKKPQYQKESQPVYLMTEKITPDVKKLKNHIANNFKSPIFLNSIFMRNVENWDRSEMQNQKYKKARDRRKRYTLTSSEAISKISKTYKKAPGIAYWAGHGNDPYMFQISTTKSVIQNAKGKKTVLIYPEMEDYSKNLTFLVYDLIYPLANYAQNKNANIFLRSKNIFWLGSNYTKPWARLLSGEFADVFVPSMEETSDKTMELSLSGRLGMWASGAVNSWGTRAVPDNVSFDRSRQFGYQRLPNHFLRMLIYHTAYGAQYINNFAIDQKYISLYWELIAKGALYVPKRNEVLSFSPVHISMKEPDTHFLDDGSNVKWTTFFDENFENNNPFVFSRMNGTWPAAPVTNWDFSKYAANVNERRLNFLAPYNNGLVLITPPQKGIFAQQNIVRKKLSENLHPFYKNILKEYITDGKNYFSVNGKHIFIANEYYKIIEKEIQESAKKLPVTVSGDVAWVVAQIASKCLRLTLIDNGYLNPKKSTATVIFNDIKIKKIKDILDDEEFRINTKIHIEIPLGGFRFIDIELKEEL